jgi:16S rRNA processing protein RimM
MLDPATTVVLGRILGPFGVKGAVRIFSYTDPRENILSYTPWTLYQHGQSQEARVLGGRWNGNNLSADLDGVTDRDQALTLRGADICVARARLPPLPPGEFYFADLAGLAVVNREGLALGRVRRVFQTGANDVLGVEDGGRERLIPFVQGVYVLGVDYAAGTLTVDWDPEWDAEA